MSDGRRWALLTLLAGAVAAAFSGLAVWLLVGGFYDTETTGIGPDRPGLPPVWLTSAV